MYACEAENSGTSADDGSLGNLVTTPVVGDWK